MLIVSQATFAVACFWVLSDVNECSGDLRMAPSPLDKQPAGYKSPHDWLVRLRMYLAALCVRWSQNQHWLMPFGCFQFTCTLNPPLRSSPSPPTLHLYRSVGGIGVASKKLSIMVGNLASYPFNSLYIDRLWICSYRIMMNSMQAIVFPPKIQYFKYLKLVCLNICNCALKVAFLNPVTNELQAIYKQS